MSSDIASKIEQIWHRFQDRESRHNWVASHLSTSLATQILSLREARGWTQKKLAAEAGMAQSRISLMEDADYEKFSLTTLKRLAQAFDVVFIGRFVTFSEMLEWATNLTPARLAPREFTKDRPPIPANQVRHPSAEWKGQLQLLGAVQPSLRIDQGHSLDADQGSQRIWPKLWDEQGHDTLNPTQRARNGRDAALLM